jgi:WD40 repeat protein
VPPTAGPEQDDASGTTSSSASPAGPELGDASSAAFRLGPQARIDALHVEGDVAGRDIVKITEELTYDVSDLSANPYQGLASYTYENRAFFAGRERQIADTIARLTAPGDERALIFITGASGSGKSSFVQAGVIAALEAWYADNRRTTQWTVVRPGRHPLAALGRALASLGVPEPSDADWPSLLRSSPQALSTLLGAQTPATQINLLVLDQFEELFTQAEPTEREVVCGLLSALDSFATLHSHVLVTLRSDYLSAVFNTPALFAVVKQSSIELRAMAADELARAIRQPLLEQARRDHKDKRVDPALVKRLVDDAGDDPTLLPLVQVTLTAMWDEPPHRLKLERYASLTDALQRQADRAYDLDRQGKPRSEPERRMVLNIFLDLVDVSLDDDPQRDVRRTVPKRDLVGDEVERARLIDELVDARLLATTVEQRGDATVDLVDIIHESLLRNWSRLHEAIMSAREMLQSRERLRLAVHDWLDHDRSDDYLLVGVRLAEAQQLAAAHDILARDANTRALLQVSTERQEQERQHELEQARALAEVQRARADDSLRAAHRLRIWLSVAVLLAVLAVIGAGGAMLGFRRADDQANANRSRELAAEAQAQVESDGDLGILLAQAAMGVWDTTEAEAALRQVLVRSPARTVIRPANTGVTAAHFSPSGDSVLTGGRDGSVRPWDAGSGTLLGELSKQSSPITAAAFRPGGGQVAAVTADGVARVWDLSSGALLAELAAPGGTLLAYSPNARWLAVGAANGSVHIVDDLTLLAGPDLGGHGGAVLAVNFSADSKRLVTASADQTARVWELDSVQPPLELRGHSAFVADAAFDATGDRVVTASADGSARIWNAHSGATELELRGHDGAVRSAMFSPDGTRVLTAGADGTTRLWDAVQGDRHSTVLVGHTQPVQRASFGPGGRQIVTASADGTARVWDGHTGQLVADLRGHTREVTSAEFSPDGQQVLTASVDGTARVWQVDSGKEWLGLVGHMGKVYAAAFAPDGRAVASGGADNTVRIWPLVGQDDVVTRTVAGAVGSLEYSPDGRKLIVGFIGGTAAIVDSSGQGTTPELRLAGHSGFLYTASFSPDATRALTTGSDKVARIWSALDGRLIGELVGHSGDVTGAAFSPDGRRVATASFDGTVRIWDSATLQMLHELRGHVGEVYRVRFMPDGLRVVSAGEDASLRVWDVESGRELTRRTAHVRAIYALAISADGRTALSAGVDREVLVWDTSDWHIIGQLTGATQDVLSVGFSADGQRALVSSADGSVRLYRRELFAPIREVLELASTRVVRQPPTLLPEERIKYLHEG